MGIEYEEDLSPGYGYQQHNYTMAQQNYTTHQPKFAIAQQNYTTHHPNYTMAQHNYNMEEEHGYDDNTYYSSNDRHYSSHVGLNQAIPTSYQQQHRVVQPVALYAQPPTVRNWGSTNSQQHFGNRAPKYSGSGYSVHQNSSGGYQSEWMY
ncbi:hypothetical protein AgCh_009343 [Apium graveolens]